MRKIAFHNLGCKVNSYEMDYIAQNCEKYGYEITDFDGLADIYVINTCSVTNIADRKSRQMIHKARKNNPQGTVVALGCFVQANPEEVMKDEAIDLIIGNNRKKDFFELIGEYERIKNNGELPLKDLGGKTIEDVFHCEYEEMKVSSSAERSRAYVKIQDGCDRYCTYCIIPYTRGNIRSRKPSDVVEEIEMIAQRGYKEVVLTGIHISSYGKDFEKSRGPETELLNLLEAIDRISGIERIRIGSFEPMLLSEDFVKGLAKVGKLCPHFHISLQSGSDSVLKRMNRHYDTKAYFDKTLLLRKYFEGCAITTDVIVGFPGETAEEFEETLNYLIKIKFYETHIFPYSRRKGTIADRMPGQLTEKQKKERVRTLLSLDAKESLNFRKGKIGKETNIIVEETKEIEGREYLIGHTPEYITVAYRPREGFQNGKFIGELVDLTMTDMLTDEIVLGVEKE